MAKKLNKITAVLFASMLLLTGSVDTLTARSVFVREPYTAPIDESLSSNDTSETTSKNPFGLSMDMQRELIEAGADMQIESGAYHSLTLKEDGTVWAWGENDKGQLGNGLTSSAKLTKKNISGKTAPYNKIKGLRIHGKTLDETYDEILKGYEHLDEESFKAITEDVDAVITDLQTFSDSITTDLVPNNLDMKPSANTLIRVVGLEDIIAISAGISNNMALKEDGTVWYWGSGILLPVQAENLTDITAIATGEDYFLALKNDGSVWAWGANGWGQLGDGTYNDSELPVRVFGLSNIISIAAGQAHSVALGADGIVWAWGNNRKGQLGNGTWAGNNIPMPVPSLGGITEISAIDFYTMATAADGTTWFWGEKVKHSTIPAKPSPVTCRN